MSQCSSELDTGSLYHYSDIVLSIFYSDDGHGAQAEECSASNTSQFRNTDEL